MRAPGSNAIIEGVGSHSILDSWGSIEPLLLRVFERFDIGYNTEELLTKLQIREMQLWQVNDFQAVAVTQIKVLPEFKTLSILFTAGDDVDEWLSVLIDVLSEFAAFHECKYLDYFGRPGWVRKSKHLGFDEHFSIGRLEIDGRQGRQRSSTK